MRADGKSFKECGASLGRAMSSVWQKAKSLGLVVKAAEATQMAPDKLRHVQIGVGLTASEFRVVKAAAEIDGITPGRFMEKAAGGEKMKKNIIGAAMKALRKAVG